MWVQNEVKLKLNRQKVAWSRNNVRAARLSIASNKYQKEIDTKENAAYLYVW